MATKIDHKTATFEIYLTLRQADEGNQAREPDPRRDLFSVWIKNHSTCKPGIPRRVAFTACEKVVNAEGEQISGRLCWIVQHGLHKADMLRIASYVEEWQGSTDMQNKSRETQDETT
jgi:hypothetical protein